MYYTYVCAAQELEKRVVTVAVQISYVIYFFKAQQVVYRKRWLLVY